MESAAASSGCGSATPSSSLWRRSQPTLGRSMTRLEAQTRKCLPQFPSPRAKSRCALSGCLHIFMQAHVPIRGCCATAVGLCVSRFVVIVHLWGLGAGITEGKPQPGDRKVLELAGLCLPLLLYNGIVAYACDARPCNMLAAGGGTHANAGCCSLGRSQHVECEGASSAACVGKVDPAYHQDDENGCCR